MQRKGAFSKKNSAAASVQGWSIMEERRYPSTSVAVESKQDFAKCEEVALVILRKSSSSSTRTSLGHLPNELLIKILALLPLHTLMHLRLVCKSWNDPLLRTPILWESWASHQYCWVVMVRKQKGLFAKEFLALCLTTSEAGRGRRHGGHWLSLSSMLQSPQISPHLGGKYAQRVMCRQVEGFHGILSHSFCQVAGAQGLMCFLIEAVKQPLPAASDELRETRLLYMDTFDENQPSLLVVEVLTGATQMLPAPPLPERFQYTLSLLSMSLLPSSRSDNHYRIVLYDSTLTYFDIYDSQSNSWTSVLGIGHPFTDCPASADVQHGDLFWLRKLLGATCEELVTYNLEANAWSKITVPSPSNAYGFRPLVTKCRGRIVFVDLLVAANLTVDGVGIWELQLSSSTPGGANWVLVVRSPPLYSKGFFYKFPPKNRPCTDIKFIVFGSLICLTGAAGCNSKYGADFFHPLVYDFDLKSWYNLPAYEGSVEMLGLFAFSPLSSSK